jgi:hypothetical protein
VKITIPDPWQGYPPSWSLLEQLVTAGRYGEIGFARPVASANRFAARYRFATSIKEIVLNGYTQETHAGYTALARASLAYSAFEAILQLIGVPSKDTSRLLRRYPVTDWLGYLRRHDPKQLFFGFIEARVAPHHEKTNLAQFLKGQGCDFTAIARSVRHIFFHGELTPNAGGSSPQDVCAICECIFSGLVEIMGREFSDRLAPFKGA